MGKNYARLVDLGLGASKPQWNVWFELCFLQLDQLIIEKETSEYFRSDLRLGPNGYQSLISLNQEELHQWTEKLSQAFDGHGN